MAYYAGVPLAISVSEIVVGYLVRPYNRLSEPHQAEVVSIKNNLCFCPLDLTERVVDPRTH